MTITTSGFDGTMSEARWSDLHELIADDICSGFGPSAGGGTRVISLTSGKLVGAGVLFRSSAVDTVVLDPNGGGNPRIDLVVANIDWSGTGGVGTLTAVKGTNAASPVAPALTRTAGSTWQVPLAQVTVVPGVGTIAGSDVTDVRPLRRKLKVVRVTPAANGDMLSTDTSPAILGVAAIDDPGWAYRLRIFAQEKFDVLSGNGFGRVDVTIDGNSVAECRAPAKNEGLAQLYFITAPMTGACTVRMRMLPVQMSGEHLKSASAYAQFSVEVEPI